MLKKSISLLVFILIGTCISTNAQYWTVGVPVYEEIIDFPIDIEVTAYCDSMSGQEAEFRIPLPPVTGVQYYIHIDNAIPNSDSFKVKHNGITHILALYDSLLVAPMAAVPCPELGQPCDIIKISYNGPSPQLAPSSCSLKFTAHGTPTVPFENYPHSNCDDWFNLGIECLYPHHVAQISQLTGDSCYTTTRLVQPTNSINEYMGDQIQIYPNPSSNEFNISTSADIIGERFTLYDISGKVVKEGLIHSTNTTLSSENLEKGIYFLSVKRAPFTLHKIIIE